MTGSSVYQMGWRGYLHLFQICLPPNHMAHGTTTVRTRCQLCTEVTERQMAFVRLNDRLNDLIKSCGDVTVAKKHTDEHDIVPYNANDTWQKIRNKLPQFVSDVCGNNLEINAA